MNESKDKTTLFEVLFERKPVLNKVSKEDPRIEAFKKKLFPEESKPKYTDQEII